MGGVVDDSGGEPGASTVDRAVAAINAAAASGRPVIVDIGGEGRYALAWNLNPSAVKTIGPRRGEPIPRHLPGRADAIPLADGSVDLVIVERTPLRRAALGEIARVVSPVGVVILRHVVNPHRDRHALAAEILRGAVVRRVTRIGGQTVQESILRLAGPG